MQGTNGIGIPFDKCHCFDLVSRVCHFCGLRQDDYWNSDHTLHCTRVLEPVDCDYQEYVHAVVRTRIICDRKL